MILTQRKSICLSSQCQIIIKYFVIIYPKYTWENVYAEENTHWCREPIHKGSLLAKLFIKESVILSRYSNFKGHFMYKIKPFTKLADTHTKSYMHLVHIAYHLVSWQKDRNSEHDISVLIFWAEKVPSSVVVVVVLYPCYTVAISEQNHCVKFFAIKPRVEIEEARIPTSTSTTSFISFPNFCSLFLCSQKGMNVWYFFKPMFVFQLVQLAVVGLDRSIPIAVGQAFWESFRW